MNKFVYFLAIGLAFTVLQVVTVEADHDATHMVPPMCGDVPCPTGDDTGGTDVEDCAAKETPALVAACWDRNRPATEAGMAPGTQECRDAGGAVIPCPPLPMCGDVPCPPPTGDGAP